MIKFTTILALVALLFASVSHALVTPPAPCCSLKNNCRGDTTATQLHFQKQSSEEKSSSPRVTNPTYKVTKLQFSDALERERTSKRKTLAANIRGKAMDLLLRSYEIDQLEYGL